MRSALSTARPGPASCLLAALILFSLPAVSAPLAGWAGETGLAPAVGLRFADLKRARCLPQSDDVSVPVYPQASIIDLAWGRQPPDCRRRAGWPELGAIRLVTHSDVETVASWYMERLADHARFDTAQGVIFLRGEPGSFNFERDYYKYPNVYVRAADADWRAAGFVSIIELNRPAP